MLVLQGQPVKSCGAGLNLPPLQGSTNSGAFSTGPLNYKYPPYQIAAAAFQRSAIRIGINPATVSDEAAWQDIRTVVNLARDEGASVVLCMWDSDNNDIMENGHGDGIVDDESSARNMWGVVGGSFSNDSEVFFEAFNEPFGYMKAEEYVAAMKRITQDLPEDRVIIDGMGFGGNVQMIKDIWPGLLGYHAYPFFLPKNQRRQGLFSIMVQDALNNVADRVFVTEFGTNVTLAGEDYNDVNSSSQFVQFLLGMDDAFEVMKPRGTYYWHGRVNGDAYSFWAATESARNKLDSVQTYC